MKNIIQKLYKGTLVIFLILLWVIILLNPVFFYIQYDNPLLLFLYSVLPIEFLIGVLITGAVASELR
jgi:hypothetical protein